MLRTASSLPLQGFDAEFRRRAFPPAASLLPGLLAATRTGLPPAGEDELTNGKIRCYVTASPPALLGAQDSRPRRRTSAMPLRSQSCHSLYNRERQLLPIVTQGKLYLTPR